MCGGENEGREGQNFSPGKKGRETRVYFQPGESGPPHIKGSKTGRFPPRGVPASTTEWIPWDSGPWVVISIGVDFFFFFFFFFFRTSIPTYSRETTLTCDLIHRPYRPSNCRMNYRPPCPPLPSFDLSMPDLPVEHTMEMVEQTLRALAPAATTSKTAIAVLSPQNMTTCFWHLSP
eukprot:FR736869.1.p2 GENE.FR736869.1~~FR736869.1.p2  ORF type:complete len:176 (-),score=45.29 FR736869.1:542-1069(-)